MFEGNVRTSNFEHRTSRKAPELAVAREMDGKLTRLGFIEEFGGCPTVACHRQKSTKPASDRRHKGISAGIKV
jgi:hypothetical protein